MNIYKLPVNAYNRGHEQTISEDIVRNKLVGKKKKRKEPSLWWKCERCGKLIPYMADFCHECADEILGDPPESEDKNGTGN